LRADMPDWFGYARTGVKSFGLNAATMSVFYKLYPILQQNFRNLSEWEKAEHKTAMQEAAMTLACVRRWLIGWTDENLALEFNIPPEKAKALRRRFFDTGNNLNSVEKIRFEEHKLLWLKNFAASNSYLLN
jgi:hypothetical protein